MKTHLAFQLSALALWLAVCPSVHARTKDDPKEFDDAHRFIFYAVLEGCYEDGISNEDVAQTLMRRKKECYFHFIYACPVCTAVIQALETYRSRPESFYSLKTPASTFGGGLDLASRKKLFSEKAEDRLAIINTLVQKWISHRMDIMKLTPKERAKLEKDIEEKRQQGMRTLKSFKKPPEGKPSVRFYAPAYLESNECAACNGAVGKVWKPGIFEQKEPMRAP